MSTSPKTPSDADPMGDGNDYALTMLTCEHGNIEPCGLCDIPDPSTNVDAEMGLVELNDLVVSLTEAAIMEMDADEENVAGIEAWGQQAEKLIVAFVLRTKAEDAKLIAELRSERDTPEVIDFAKAVQLEAWHQRDRWGADHDGGKSPLDWFWLIGYLAQKAAAAQIAGDTDKALHHTISTASALANWHLALSGGDSRMRPGIEPPALNKGTGE